MAGGSVVGSSTSVIATSVVLGGWSHPAPAALRSPWSWLGLVRRCTYALRTAFDGCAWDPRPVAWRGASGSCAPGALGPSTGRSRSGFTVAVVLITRKIQDPDDPGRLLNWLGYACIAVRRAARWASGAGPRSPCSPSRPVAVIVYTGFHFPGGPVYLGPIIAMYTVGAAYPRRQWGFYVGVRGRVHQLGRDPARRRGRDRLVPRRLLHLVHRGRVHRRRGPLPPRLLPRLGGTGPLPGGVPRGGVTPARGRGTAAHRPRPPRRRRPQPGVHQHPGRRGRARRRRPSRTRPRPR